MRHIDSGSCGRNLPDLFRGSVSTVKERTASSAEQPVFQEVEIPAEEVAEKFYYSTLSEEEQQVYQAVLQGVRNNSETINVEMTDAKRVQPDL